MKPIWAYTQAEKAEKQACIDGDVAKWPDCIEGYGRLSRECLIKVFHKRPVYPAMTLTLTEPKYALSMADWRCKKGFWSGRSKKTVSDASLREFQMQ